MPHVNLYSPNGTREIAVSDRSVAIPHTPAPDLHQETKQATAHHRGSAYAAMKDLSEDLNTAGIEADQVWEYLKADHCVNSRAKFTLKQWIRVAARLQAAKWDPESFKLFVDGIPDQYFRIHVYAADPNVCIGRPRDTRKHHIPSEWGDFQQIANEAGCLITVEQGKSTCYYEPCAPELPETYTAESDGAPHSDCVEQPPNVIPTVSLETNVYGQILSPWGEILEVR